jgi:hypothetical protein
MTATQTAPDDGRISVDITWVISAMEREHIKHRIRPGEWFKMSYEKIYDYCPDDIRQLAASYGHPGFVAVSACVRLAEENGILEAKRAKGRANSYRLIMDHPAVWDVFMRTKARLIMPETDTLH